jgi:hypothetical protein
VVRDQRGRARRRREREHTGRGDSGQAQHGLAGLPTRRRRIQAGDREGRCLVQNAG